MTFMLHWMNILFIWENKQQMGAFQRGKCDNLSQYLYIAITETVVVDGFRVDQR